jgi:hypothetical protein
MIYINAAENDIVELCRESNILHLPRISIASEPFGYPLARTDRNLESGISIDSPASSRVTFGNQGEYWSVQR